MRRRRRGSTGEKKRRKTRSKPHLIGMIKKLMTVIMRMAE